MIMQRNALHLKDIGLNVAQKGLNIKKMVDEVMKQDAPGCGYLGTACL